MPKSTRPRRKGKPTKAARDFPLWKHPSGRWCKKVGRRAHYFGKVADDPNGQAALERWLEVKDDLLAGREPRSQTEDGLTVGTLCNHFLTHKQSLMDVGELAPRTFGRYYATCAMLVDALGKRRPVDDLRPEDFQVLRRQMAKRWAPIPLANEVQMVRSIFRFGFENGLLEKPIRFGVAFRKPSAKVIRQARIPNGPRLFTPEEVQRALEHASPNMKAMVLLALNGGLGNTDLALLPIKVIDLKAGWLDYARSKTAIMRRIPLWPETVYAIQAVLPDRREPKNPADTGLLFIGLRGQSYVGGHKGSRVTGEWNRTAKKAGIEGRTFYDFRRTFQTIAEGEHDLVAVQSIMGHAPASGNMSAIYRQRVDDNRMRAVTEHVRKWLFGEATVHGVVMVLQEH